SDRSEPGSRSGGSGQSNVQRSGGDGGRCIAHRGASEPVGGLERWETTGVAGNLRGIDEGIASVNYGVRERVAWNFGFGDLLILCFAICMDQAMYDALVIGGGPGGSAAGTFLARAGKRVLVLEKEHFPRFHIGESLLPYNHQIFEAMGVLPALEAAGLIKKHGAQFHLGDASKSLLLAFRNGRFNRQRVAFQVERASFDHLLLQHARSSGAEVREGWTVTKFGTDSEGATVQARNAQGQAEILRGAFLLDASGRAN